MKKNLPRFIKSLLVLLFPILAMAQENKDYSLNLNSGNFLPKENIKNFSKQSAEYRQSGFNGKHYLVIQFTEIPGQALKTQMASAGITLLDYIPNYAYTASVSSEVNFNQLKSYNIRSITRFSAAQKTSADVLAKKVPSYAEKIPGYADVDLLLYENIAIEKIFPVLKKMNAEIITQVPAFKMVTVRVTKNNLPQLAELPFVQWVEFIAPPNVPENLPGRSLHRANILNDGVRNLKGDGMNIGVWDERASQHLDFSPAGRMINVDAGAAGSHGTHVSGTIGSRGLINPIARGMAPNANIYSYYGFSGDVQTAMATAIPANTLISSNHSYHDGLGVQCGTTGASAAYSLRARNTDINLNNFPYHLHCHSSGNAQTSCASGWGTITGTGKAAKNNLVVGAITSLEAMTSYSSFGPVHDGRVKPEITAMGDNVFSTYTPLNSYSTISGTSMSTPGITGTVALLAQRYKQLNANALPPSALIKNIVCNTAKDLGTPGPDYRFGFGSINALAAVKILEQNRYALNSVATAVTNDITITVPAGASRLRVMLTWNDPAAAANVALALVNNLDLSVINGATTTLPWVLDKFNPALDATKALDNVSNIEQVTIDNPPAGTYTLRVQGSAITLGPSQSYALTWDVNQPYTEVIYPNGGESLNPGSSHVITWDNSGVTSTQTVEYSLNNGTTWTTISSSVAATTNRLTWSVPAANTATALIRITSGAITDVSDVNFKILGTVTGFSTAAGGGCNSGEITFNWNAVTNATHYDIYNLDANTGQFVIFAANRTGTTYTAAGLTPGTNMWFTIVSKDNNINSQSERALAINATVSSGGGGLGTIGSISGTNNVCSDGQSVSYSISPVTGATSYTWTTPAGTTIVSGQGSNAVMINFPAGSSSGNVTVYASSGACQTPAATFTVNVNNAPVAPVTGGNQVQNHCPPTPIATLTATAAVPAGHTITWYDAATGGNIVANPSLSVSGTITYYASSTNNATSCVSTNRTPVTLTINSAPPATVTTGGPTTFCDGGSVLLTANAGSSYSWSNGATTQSITVLASGSYTVVVTQTGGCTLTSNPVSVTVNAKPSTSVTANSPTNFCDGSSVILTAPAGSSWLWSNGAVTQSITSTTSGNYSVTTTNAAGCVSNSAVTAVTVSPKPVVTLSAAPYLKLFPGLSTTLTASVTPSGSYVYSWLKNGNAISATGNSIPVTLADLGSYSVTVTNATGLACSNTSNSLAIGDSATNRLFVYPNPTSGVFQVNYYTTSAASHTVSIFDAKGALVFRKPYAVIAPYQRMEVDIRQHGKGIYQVVLHDKNGVRLAEGRVLLR